MAMEKMLALSLQCNVAAHDTAGASTDDSGDAICLYGYSAKTYMDLLCIMLNAQVMLTIRSDALPRETSFESAATRCANLAMLRPGMAQPGPPEPRERWAALNMMDLGTHTSDALQLLHLRGYHSPLSMLPDLSAARLTRLQVCTCDACLLSALVNIQGAPSMIMPY
jgi:hypothetical protein